MVDLSDSEFEAATKRGIHPKGEPRAVAAYFDATSRRIVVELDGGTSFSFPADMAQDLENASDEDLADIELLGGGFGLHWEKLDVDFTVAGLAAGIFGTARYMAQQAGRARSEAKAAAARANGAAGGRPRKTAG